MPSVLMMSLSRKINKDIGVDLIHYLRDDLYKLWQTME
jgi:hypothetical protein